MLLEEPDNWNYFHGSDPRAFLLACLQTLPVSSGREGQSLQGCICCHWLQRVNKTPRVWRREADQKDWPSSWFSAALDQGLCSPHSHSHFPGRKEGSIWEASKDQESGIQSQTLPQRLTHHSEVQPGSATAGVQDHHVSDKALSPPTWKNLWFFEEEDTSQQWHTNSLSLGSPPKHRALPVPFPLFHKLHLFTVWAPGQTVVSSLRGRTTASSLFWPTPWSGPRVTIYSTPWKSFCPMTSRSSSSSCRTPAWRRSTSGSPGANCRQPSRWSWPLWWSTTMGRSTPCSWPCRSWGPSTSTSWQRSFTGWSAQVSGPKCPPLSVQPLAVRGVGWKVQEGTCVQASAYWLGGQESQVCDNSCDFFSWSSSVPFSGLCSWSKAKAPSGSKKTNPGGWGSDYGAWSGEAGAGCLLVESFTSFVINTYRRVSSVEQETNHSYQLGWCVILLSLFSFEFSSNTCHKSILKFSKGLSPSFSFFPSLFLFHLFFLSSFPSFFFYPFAVTFWFYYTMIKECGLLDFCFLRVFFFFFFWFGKGRGATLGPVLKNYSSMSEIFFYI